ncbi:GTPaseactivator protein for Ras-like GTPase [Acanthamoeba castellanii str. Neff]|uniref:GTPaseactivator protein for Ras-like GTPase n=1 Tax=Acanthamoeba castellanii (strain ATCC 30010 / Neff) TaxID=1257118 RepID=L8HCD3_ACACF|nr:GTPaseactivator protein for Ras-like GTPase [Acanthamoeba castellanii str. Neff]ELR22855.1 GTPaseactivator protein for Ras-like GTPase [Acanthamoeba castellanii str. Neff]
MEEPRRDDKENLAPTSRLSFSCDAGDLKQEGFHLKQVSSGIRLTRRDQEQINELRKQLASTGGGELSAPCHGGEATASQRAGEEEEEVATSQRLLRMSHLSRRTSTPLRELFQQSLAAAAAAMLPDAKPLLPNSTSSASGSSTPSEGRQGAGAPPVATVEGIVTTVADHRFPRATGKRKSDADTVLERLAASAGDNGSSPHLLLVAPAPAPLHNGDEHHHLLEEVDRPFDQAGGDDGDYETGDGKEVDQSAMEQSVMNVDASISMDSATAQSSQQHDVPPLSLGTVFDSPRSSSASVDTRLDKRSSFLRRTFSMKKLKPGTFTANKDPRLAFLRLLTEQELAVTNALLEVGSEDVAKSVLVLFDGTGQAARLLKCCLQRELHATASEGTLFRGVSVGTRLMSHFMRLHGRTYLEITLTHFFETLLPKDIQLEVDPNRATADAGAISHGCTALAHLAGALLNALFSAPGHVPEGFRDLFASVRAEVLQRFPEMEDKVVGGFFFLRFICPALVAPEQWGLVAGMRRALILISKVVQNVANEVEFGDKEAYMMPMNGFIKEYIPRMKHFLGDISATAGTPSTPRAAKAWAEDPTLLWANDEFMASLFDVFDEVSLHADCLAAHLQAGGQGLLAEELHSVGKELPSREGQLKKRTREQRATKKKEHKRKERRHRRSLSDTELEVLETTAPKTGGTPGRRQLNRLLSTSKKLLPRFASDNHDERPTTGGSGTSTTDNTGASRKFLKARRKASASSAATLD